MRKLLPLVVLLLFVSMDLAGQCFPDRHNLSLANAWLSCETSMSPNLARGEGHWIMYDLGTSYALGQTTFWNINNYLRQDDGMQEVTIDLSNNGTTWTEAARFTLPKGPVSGTYEGVSGPDLTDNMARFVLISGLSNYGGDCMGLSEFKVQATPATTGISRIDLGAEMQASPNPFAQQTIIDVDLQQDGDYRYEVISVQGQVLRQGTVEVQGSTAQIIVDGDNLQAGAYIFSVMNDQARSSINLIKQ